MSDPDRDLAVAALALVTSLSKRNYDRGLTYWVQIPRGKVADLARALEAATYPGVIARAYEEIDKAKGTADG